MFFLIILWLALYEKKTKTIYSLENISIMRPGTAMFDYEKPTHYTRAIWKNQLFRKKYKGRIIHKVVLYMSICSISKIPLYFSFFIWIINLCMQCSKSIIEIYVYMYCICLSIMQVIMISFFDPQNRGAHYKQVILWS